MAKPTATQDHVAGVETVLRQHQDLHHLRVTRRGGALTLVSGPPDDPIAHVRLTLISKTVWRVDMPKGTRGWEQTPFAGPIPNVILGVVEDFGWTLEPLDNPVPTSDPRY